MRKASVAEWIISGFTDRHRAAAIVGDLLESTSPKSALRFWCPVAGIVFSLVWRRTIAFVAAFYLCLRWMGPLTMRIWGTTHRPPETWMGVFGGLCGIATLLWAIFPYAIVRFGIRDRLARLAGAFTVLSTVLIYFWWIPAVVVACLAACVAIVVGSMLFPTVAQGVGRTLCSVRPRAVWCLDPIVLAGVVSDIPGPHDGHDAQLDRPHNLFSNPHDVLRNLCVLLCPSAFALYQGRSA